MFRSLSRRFLTTTCLAAKEHGFESLRASGLPLPKLDIRSIVENLPAKEKNIAERDYEAVAASSSIQRISSLYGEHRTGTQHLNFLRNQKSQLSSAIRDSRPSDPRRQDLLVQSAKIKEEIHQLSAHLSSVELEMHELASLLPNDTHPKSPVGPQRNATVLYQSHGRMGLTPSTAIRDHVHIASKLNLADFEAGARVTGSSWAYLLNEAAILEHALSAFALATAVRHGFKVVSGPDVVRAHIAQRCGFHPREERTATEQAYTLGPKHSDLVLSGTAEIPLAGLYSNSIVDLNAGSCKLVAFGRAFRVEAGSRGRDTRGLYRLHQFSKVELFALTPVEDSESCMEEMLQVQKDVVESLGIPFRILDMPTEELGASSYRKYDIEAWMPGRGSWGEICSLSNCTDYQSRRLHIRYKPRAAELSSPPLPFVHTLNGTAAAIPRLIIALLENCARFGEGDGNVIGLDLPACLQTYWLGDAHQTGTANICWI